MIADFLAGLAARGVHLAANGDRLHVDAPANVLTDSDRDLLRANKGAILALLAPPCPECASPGHRLGTVLIDGQGRFECPACAKVFWAPSAEVADAPRWDDGLSDEDYQGVVTFDIAEHGYYSPSRCYWPLEAEAIQAAASD